MKKMMITLGLVAVAVVAVACDSPAELRGVDVRVDAEQEIVALDAADGQHMQIELGQLVLHDDEGVEMSLDASPVGDGVPTQDLPLIDDIDPTLVCCYGCFITPWGVFCNYCDPFATCDGGGSSSSTTGEPGDSTTTSTTTSTTNPTNPTSPTGITGGDSGSHDYIP